MWFITGFLDTILKLFQYAWFLIIPIIIIIIVFILKRAKIDKNNIKKRRIYLFVIIFLIILVVVSLFTIRIWGPSFYREIISLSICNKEEIIEKKLEKKYGKNFDYISQEEIEVEKYSGSALGQNVDNDYSVRYFFKDDDGVLAIINYKKNYQSDYYESKRSKYEIEKEVYDYAEKVRFNNEFYVYVESPYELINDSKLDDKVDNNLILGKKYHNRIVFILTEKSDRNQEFIVSALKKLLGSNSNIYVNEYVVTDSEYERAVEFYESLSSKKGIVGHDYEESFKFDKNNQKQYKYYFVK